MSVPPEDRAEFRARSLRLHRFIPRTEVEGPGARACVWVQGCHLACPGCFNPETHDYRAPFFYPVFPCAGKMEILARLN